MTKNNTQPLIYKTGNGDSVQLWIQTYSPKCSVCNALIEDFNIVFITDWTKEGVFYHYLHIGCVAKFKKHPLSVTQYRINALVTEKVPPRSVPVMLSKPSFSPRKGDVTVFEPDKIPSLRETDKRRHAPLLDGDAPVVIGAPDNQRLEELETPVNDVDGFLEGLKVGSKKAIQEKNKGLLD